VHANTAAVIRNDTGVSIADAHIGAAVEGSPNIDITVITSDPYGIRKVAGDCTITVVTI